MYITRNIININIINFISAVSLFVNMVWLIKDVCFSVYLGSFPGVKWPGHKVGHSPSPSAEV